MKLIKIVSLALLGTVALGVCSVKAQGAPIFQKLNFSLIIQEQASYETNKNGDGKTYLWTLAKMKLNNKALLKFMEKMFNTNWPAGAQLAYDMSGPQLIVVDQTGNNVLFYCGDGVDDVNRYAYVKLDLLKQLGPYSGQSIQAIPGSDKFTGNWLGSIDIHYENFSDETAYVAISGGGLNVENYSEKTESTGKTETRAESFTPFAIGTFDSVSAVMTGTITGKGKGTISAPGGGSGGFIIGLPPQ